MNIPFLGNWHKKRGPASGVAVFSASGGGSAGERGSAGGRGSAGDESAGDGVSGSLAGLLSECELLRSQAYEAGVELDDSAASLEALDQLLPRWRDDEERLDWLGNDAGLYLGTVIVRTVPGAMWLLWPGGQPVVRLSSGREVDVVAYGHDWAASGAPGLTQLYAEASEV
ncbi:DUF6278 family protein [Streptomyces sp. NPDC008313]|uniref:DUF6278 family protein n=1 Tax=Streptomyces sp. NPDC008313 TaxID=3364826 RepID=UPI0036E5C258